MKTDILKGQWSQIRSGLKANWDKITEDDLDAIGGNEQAFLAVLQKRYGLSPDTAAREFWEFMKRQAEEKKAGDVNAQAADSKRPEKKTARAGR